MGIMWMTWLCLKWTPAFRRTKNIVRLTLSQHDKRVIQGYSSLPNLPSGPRSQCKLCCRSVRWSVVPHNPYGALPLPHRASAQPTRASKTRFKKLWDSLRMAWSNMVLGFTAEKHPPLSNSMVLLMTSWCLIWCITSQVGGLLHYPGDKLSLCFLHGAVVVSALQWMCPTAEDGGSLWGDTENQTLGGGTDFGGSSSHLYLLLFLHPVPLNNAAGLHLNLSKSEL